MADIINPNELTDVTVERIVLAFMLVDSITFLEVVYRISKNHFYIKENKVLYDVITQLYSNGVENIDKITLVHELSKDVTLKVVNLNFIIDSLYTVLEYIDKVNITYFIDKLDNIYNKRELFLYLTRQVSEVKKNIKDENALCVDFVERAESGLLRYISKDDTDEPENVFSDLKPFINDLLAIKKDIVGLKTGFPVLDDHIDGLENGTLTVIAAHKKTGKSACCMNIALNTAIKERLPVLYIDTEMSTYKNKTRILSNITCIPEKRLKRGDVSNEEKMLIDDVIEKLDGVMYFHKYVPGFTLDGVLALIKAYHVKYGIKLAIFDYIKSGSSSDFRNMKEYQLLGNMAIGLKDLAGVLDIPILTAVQRSRDGDIADSDRIARYADTVIFFETRTKDELEELGFDYGFYKFVVKHARSGGTTNDKGIGVQFNRPILTIYEAEKQLAVEEIAPKDVVETNDVSSSGDEETLTVTDSANLWKRDAY